MKTLADYTHDQVSYVETGISDLQRVRRLDYQDACLDLIYEKLEVRDRFDDDHSTYKAMHDLVSIILLLF